MEEEPDMRQILRELITKLHQKGVKIRTEAAMGRARERKDKETKKELLDVIKEGLQDRDMKLNRDNFEIFKSEAEKVIPLEILGEIKEYLLRELPGGNQTGGRRLKTKTKKNRKINRKPNKKTKKQKNKNKNKKTKNKKI
jgi:hypothetical protein